MNPLTAALWDLALIRSTFWLVSSAYCVLSQPTITRSAPNSFVKAASAYQPFNSPQSPRRELYLRLSSLGCCISCVSCLLRPDATTSCSTPAMTVQRLERLSDRLRGPRSKDHGEPESAVSTNLLRTAHTCAHIRKEILDGHNRAAWTGDNR
jgi:hypothetical protein